jgi:hypothetical protein
MSLPIIGRRVWPRGVMDHTSVRPLILLDESTAANFVTADAVCVPAAISTMPFLVLLCLAPNCNAPLASDKSLNPQFGLPHGLVSFHRRERSGPQGISV